MIASNGDRDHWSHAIRFRLVVRYSMAQATNQQFNDVMDSAARSSCYSLGNCDLCSQSFWPNSTGQRSGAQFRDRTGILMFAPVSAFPSLLGWRSEAVAVRRSFSRRIILEL